MKLSKKQKTQIAESLMGLGERIPDLVEWLVGERGRMIFGMNEQLEREVK